MGSNSWHVRVAGLIIISAACAPAALAQERTRPPVLVVEDLLGKDWKAARLAKDELARIGARSVIPLLEARAAAPLRSDVRSPIDSTLRGIVRVLSEEIGRPLGEPAERVSADGALGGILGACDRERTDVSTVAIEPNEFGELGIDQALLGDGSDTYVELEGGCVCCKLSDERYRYCSALTKSPTGKRNSASAFQVHQLGHSAN